MVAFAVLAVLIGIRNKGVWGYLLHRPASIDAASISLWLGFAVWPLILTLALFSVAHGLGRRVLAACGLREQEKLNSIVSVALGLGLLGQAIFLMGWAGWLTPIGLAILFGGAVAVGLGTLKVSNTLTVPRMNRPQALATGTAAFAVFHLIVVSLAPTTSWDVRAYHLALPELYLKAGRLIEIPWLLHSHWPHLMEVLYTLPLAAGRDSSAALLHAGTCVLLAAGVASAGGGWPAVLLLIGQPAFLRVAPTAHADGACALFYFATALALSRWVETKRAGWLATAGLLAGFCAASKLFGAVGAAAWTLWLAHRTRRPREAALFAFCAATVLGPWLLRTWLETGDPVWPLLRQGAAAAELAARNARTNLWNWPPPPWLLAHDGPAFLLAPLAGLALIGRGAKQPSRLELILWVPAPLLFLLAFRHHEAWRYLMPAYAATALTGGRLAAAAFAGTRARRFAAAALIAFAAAPVLALTQNNELFAVLGLSSSAEPAASPRVLFEDRSVDVARFYREARNVLPAGSRVLLFREVRGYRAGFDYLWGDPVNQNQIAYRRLPDFDALSARLRELGVTHVLDHPDARLYAENPLYYDARTLALMSGMLARHARPLLVRDGLVLYQLL